MATVLNVTIIYSDETKLLTTENHVCKLSTRIMLRRMNLTTIHSSRRADTLVSAHSGNGLLVEK